MTSFLSFFTPSQYWRPFTNSTNYYTLKNTHLEISVLKIGIPPPTPKTTPNSLCTHPKQASTGSPRRGGDQVGGLPNAHTQPTKSKHAENTKENQQRPAPHIADWVKKLLPTKPPEFNQLTWTSAQFIVATPTLAELQTKTGADPE